MHKCTAQDFGAFHAIVDSQNRLLQAMKKKNMFFCLDKNDQFGNPVNMTLYGSGVSGVSRGLDIVYRPCIPK